MRLAVRGSRGASAGWRTLATAELARKDPKQVLTVLDRALWARPGRQLLYPAGVARGDRRSDRGA
jgi:hypothetical protein